MNYWCDYVNSCHICINAVNTLLVTIVYTDLFFSNLLNDKVFFAAKPFVISIMTYLLALMTSFTVDSDYWRPYADVVAVSAGLIVVHVLVYSITLSTVFTSVMAAFFAAVLTVTTLVIFPRLVS